MTKENIGAICEMLLVSDFDPAFSFNDSEIVTGRPTIRTATSAPAFAGGAQ